jgi:hypothetical protein
MKKFTLVVSLVALGTIAAFSGCSSSPLASENTSDMPVEASAGGEEFSSLTNPDPGAVIDSENSPSLVADNSSYSPPSFTDSAPEPAMKSPVNLGASSAGRAH